MTIKSQSVVGSYCKILLHGVFSILILPRHFVLARNMLSSCLSIHPSLRLSQAGTVPKRLNAGLRKRRHTIAQRLLFFVAKKLREIPTRSPLWGRFKLAIFDQRLAISQKRCTIGTYIDRNQLLRNGGGAWWCSVGASSACGYLYCLVFLVLP